MVTMHDGHMSRILKLSGDKKMTPDRWTTVLGSPIFAAILDEGADLSNPDAVLAALGLPVKKSRPTRRKVLAGLLELTGEPTKVPANDEFVARDKFREDTRGELPIAWLGSNFKTNFLDVVEKKVKGATLKQRKLLSSSLDSPIISALGGEEKAEVSLSHVYDFLKTADRKVWYIFYVRDAKGILWAVSAGWDSGHDGWRIGADSVTDPDEWNAGSRVVSR